jgi:hypothetical protein
MIIGEGKGEGSQVSSVLNNFPGVMETILDSKDIEEALIEQRL